MKTCPACAGPCFHIGDLGPLHWFRCRNCGHECSLRRVIVPKVRRPLDTPRQTSTNDLPQTKNQNKDQEP